eukprot:3090899-Prymnesium_polylepis.1
MPFRAFLSVWISHQHAITAVTTRTQRAFFAAPFLRMYTTCRHTSDALQIISTFIAGVIASGVTYAVVWACESTFKWGNSRMRRRREGLKELRSKGLRYLMPRCKGRRKARVRNRRPNGGSDGGSTKATSAVHPVSALPDGVGSGTLQAEGAARAYAADDDKASPAKGAKAAATKGSCDTAAATPPPSPPSSPLVSPRWRLPPQHSPPSPPSPRLPLSQTGA